MTQTIDRMKHAIKPAATYAAGLWALAQPLYLPRPRSTMLLASVMALSACTAEPETPTSSAQISSSVAAVSSDAPVSSSSSAQAESSSSTAALSSSMAASSSAPARTPIALPAKIQSEDFYRFNELTLDNKGTCGDGPVDMFPAKTEGGTCDVGWTQEGEWLEYDVTLAAPGQYDVNLALGSLNSDLFAQVDLNGVTIGSIEAPGLGYHEYRSQKVATIDLPKGEHTLRVTFLGAGMNMDYLQITDELAADCTDFANVRTVLEGNSCLACHSATQFNNLGGGLNLDSGNVGERLLERATAKTGASCSGDVIIDQANPDNSLILKLINPDKYQALTAEGCSRNPMPFSAKNDPSKFMSASDYQCVANWANHVALTETPIKVPPKEGEFVATDAGTALAKAKYVLHGGAPTDAELASMGGSQASVNKTALIDVIKTWEQTPEYEIKIKEFLRDTLQQRQLGPNNYPDQFQNINRRLDNDLNIDNVAMRNNFIDAFTRTAWRIHSNGGDFRNVINTRDWEVTTALLTAFAWADKGDTNRDQGPLRANNHLIASDYNDWRTVRLTQSNTPAAYENTAGFVQGLRNIADGGSFALQFPRVGFFSSPVFLNAWQTNADNQFRLTINQTMMIALGKTFEPSDATDHISEAGIPEEHAVKGTVCYECHRHMDPMRLVFSKFMDFRYRGKSADGNINPSFSFHGVTENFSNTNQFANILKNHPEVGPGWVQKVCVWGNSTRCNEDDPEFQRLVDVFKNNNFNMKILMRQFFSSPLFTGATETTLHTTGQDVVSLSRGNHYCKAVNARIQQINAAAGTTGGTNLCSGGQLGLVPVDQFSRGAIDLVQATHMGLFDAKSIDRECSRVAFGVFEAGNNKIFNLDAPVNDNLSFMAQYLMGYPKTHHRYQEVFDGLRRIYDLSNKPKNCDNPLTQGDNITCGFGVNERHSLKAAWFAACTSPELIGVGM